ncbi:MAG: thermonuclease family protein [Pusillimonas sp.]
MPNKTLNRFKRSRLVQVGTVLAAIAAAWLGYSADHGPVAASQVLQCTVSHVHDGDTLRASCPGQKKTARVRIRQIDAPELDQKYGIASRDYLRQICRKGDPVELNVNSVDQYDRLLADVHCNGNDVGLTMVSAGAAWVYDQYAESKLLVDAQKQAQHARKGLWRDRDAVAPWQFRREQRQ